MNRRFWLLAGAALCAAASGCCVYGQQHYGPRSLTGAQTMQECLARGGGPDLMHQSGTNTVCICRIVDGFQVLGIYGRVEKKDRGLVFDANGRLVSDDTVDKGKGVFVLGAMAPVSEVE